MTPRSPVPTVVLTTLSSDAHTWNLLFLERLLGELGYHVHNLGACVPDNMIIDVCRGRRPDLLVISSINGHGAVDGLRVITRLRAVPALAALPAVIGGKLGTDGAAGVADRRRRLTEAGFDGVFEAPADLARFQTFARAVRDAARLCPAGAR